MTDIIERLRAASKGTPEWRLKSPSGGIAMWGDEEWKLRDYLSRQQANGAFLGYHVIREFAENSGDELRLAAANEIASLRAKVAAMEDDAKRYQWLRDVGDETWPPFAKRAGLSVAKIDAAIDAAMKDKP